MADPARLPVSLIRLVSWKIRQLENLSSPLLTAESWSLIEKQFARENRYVRTSFTGSITTTYDESLWRFYELLENKVLRELGKLKSEVEGQLRMSDMQRKLRL